MGLDVCVCQSSLVWHNSLYHSSEVAGLVSFVAGCKAILDQINTRGLRQHDALRHAALLANPLAIWSPPLPTCSTGNSFLGRVPRGVGGSHQSKPNCKLFLLLPVPLPMWLASRVMDRRPLIQWPYVSAGLQQPCSLSSSSSSN